MGNAEIAVNLKESKKVNACHVTTNKRLVTESFQTFCIAGGFSGLLHEDAVAPDLDGLAPIPQTVKARPNR